MRRVADVLAELPADRGLTFAELAREVYGTKPDEPVRWQRETVGRAVRSLVARGEAATWRGADGTYDAVGLAEHYDAPCTGEDCASCRDGKPKADGEPPWYWDRRGRALAAEHGWHEWTYMPQRPRIVCFVGRPLSEDEERALAAKRDRELAALLATMPKGATR